MRGWATAPDGSDPGVIAAPCLGRCEVAPAVLDTDGADAALVEAPLPPPVFQPLESLTLLARARVADSRVLRPVRRARRDPGARARGADGPGPTCRAITESGLVGRGGAAFPAGRKWDAVAAEGGTKYVVANADESEPGTFKDRVLIEHDPFGLIEAMVLAGWAVGAEQGVRLSPRRVPRGPPPAHRRDRGRGRGPTPG